MVASLAALLAEGVSYRDIGRRLGCSKCAAVGKARRLGINPGGAAGPEPRTLRDRMDALHAKLDAVLAATRPHVEARPRLVLGPPRGAK